MYILHILGFQDSCGWDFLVFFDNSQITRLKIIKFKNTQRANSGKTNKNRTEVLEWQLYTRSTEKPHNSQSAWTQKTRGGEVRSRGLGDFLNEKRNAKAK